MEERHFKKNPTPFLLKTLLKLRIRRHFPDLIRDINLKAKTNIILSEKLSLFPLRSEQRFQRQHFYSTSTSKIEEIKGAQIERRKENCLWTTYSI